MCTKSFIQLSIAYNKINDSNKLINCLVCPQRQELESENKKLKHNLNQMRQSLRGSGEAGSAVPGSPAYTVLLDQLNASNEELEVRKEEVLILRSQLVSQKEAMQHKVWNLYSCMNTDVLLTMSLCTNNCYHQCSLHKSEHFWLHLFFCLLLHSHQDEKVRWFDT